MAPAASGTPERLRLTNRSVVVAVVLTGLTIGLLRLFAASTRVLGWLLAASIVAALLHPLVALIARKAPRGLAIAVVVLGTMATVGLMAYSVVDDLRTQADRLEKAAPDAARELERSERFGDFAREFQLVDRVQTFVDELPERLRGGDPASALRSAATRGVAFLATTVLTIFLLVHGHRLVDAGLRQIRDADRRDRVRTVLTGAYGRWHRYMTLTAARAALAGVFTWGVCIEADVPGATLLGLSVAACSVVPLVGVAVGGLPVALLAAPASLNRAGALVGLFVAYQVAEVLLVQRRIEKLSVHVGPVISLVAVMAGLELYGLGGMLGALMISAFAACLAVELAPRDESELLVAVDEVLGGDEP